jgi:hypothetical protein
VATPRGEGVSAAVADTTSGIHVGEKRGTAVPLDSLAEAADRIDGLRREELGPGDRALVSTKNSIYSLTANSDGSFWVRGGWYELEGHSPTRVEILGCTFGGQAILTHQIAAPGLFLEFADGVRTTRIRRVRRISAEEENL